MLVDSVFVLVMWGNWGTFSLVAKGIFWPRAAQGYDPRPRYGFSAERIIVDDVVVIARYWPWFFPTIIWFHWRQSNRDWLDRAIFHLKHGPFLFWYACKTLSSPDSWRFNAVVFLIIKIFVRFRFPASILYIIVFMVGICRFLVDVWWTLPTPVIESGIWCQWSNLIGYLIF